MGPLLCSQGGLRCHLLGRRDPSLDAGGCCPAHPSWACRGGSGLCGVQGPCPLPATSPSPPTPCWAELAPQLLLQLYSVKSNFFRDCQLPTILRMQSSLLGVQPSPLCVLDTVRGVPIGPVRSAGSRLFRLGGLSINNWGPGTGQEGASHVLESKRPTGQRRELRPRLETGGHVGAGGRPPGEQAGLARTAVCCPSAWGPARSCRRGVTLGWQACEPWHLPSGVPRCPRGMAGSRARGPKRAFWSGLDLREAAGPLAP